MKNDILRFKEHSTACSANTNTTTHYPDPPMKTDIISEQRGNQPIRNVIFLRFAFPMYCFMSPTLITQLNIAVMIIETNK